MKFYRILPENQALALAEKALSLSWSSGRARTNDLTGTVKQNREILNHISLDGVGKRIVNLAEIQLDHIPLKMHPPKFSRYSNGEHYKMHTDAPWMAQTRTDLSCTLWLSNDFEGGELCVNGERVKGSPGECVVYDCGAPHEVTPITSGERICIVSWMQSRIRDPAKRKLVSDFRKFLAKVEDQPELFLEGGRLHSALLRRWMES